MRLQRGENRRDATRLSHQRLGGGRCYYLVVVRGSIRAQDGQESATTRRLQADILNQWRRVHDFENGLDDHGFQWHS